MVKKPWTSSKRREGYIVNSQRSPYTYKGKCNKLAANEMYTACPVHQASSMRQALHSSRRGKKQTWKPRKR